MPGFRKESDLAIRDYHSAQAACIQVWMQQA